MSALTRDEIEWIRFLLATERKALREAERKILTNADLSRPLSDARVKRHEAISKSINRSLRLDTKLSELND